MGRRKRKSIEDFSEEDSLKQNRSSMNVNLSCTSNLTDSGNGSFKTMELECHNTVVDPMRLRRSTRNRTRLEPAVIKNICPKDASVVLEDISRADISFNIRSKLLTEAILAKTREIFNEENELTRKTSVVLQNNASIIHGHNVEHDNEACLPKSLPSHGNSSQSDKNQLLHTICTTPKKQNILNKHNIEDKEHNDNRNGTIYTSPQTPKKSPILSHSRRKLNASQFLLPKPKKLITRKTLRQSQSTYCNRERQTSEASTISTLNDESILEAFPLASSSMIQEYTNSQSKDCAGVETSNLNLYAHTHKEKSLLSMEMTDLRGGFIIEGPNTLQSRSESSTNSSIAHKSTANTIATGNNLTASKRLTAPIIQESKSQYSMKQHEVDTNNLSSTVQANSDDVEDSINSVRSSLNVNTSIDVITEDKAYRKSKETIKVQNRQSNSVVRALNDSCQTISGQEQESVNTVNTSIQVNTSLRGPYRSSFMQDDAKESHCSKNSIEDSASHGKSSLETVKIYNKGNSSNITENNEKQQETEEQNITIRNKSKSFVSENVTGKSYVEATPYPPTRSMMWRSLARQNTEMQSLEDENVNTTNHNTNTRRKDFQEYRFNITNKNTIMPQIARTIVTRTAKNSMVNLDESDVSRLPPRKIQHSVIVVDSDSEISQTKDTDTTGQKKTRKKLLPLRQNSGLISFSPADESDSAPTQSLFPTTTKKSKKKDTKHKTKTVVFHDSSIKQTQKEPKRSRRIKSKKITIKKVTNVDILKTLERERREPNKTLNSTGYNTASPSEFETKKYISTTKSAKGLPRKIVIVTTGLSKEDKALVKSVIKSIGHAKMESSVSPRTTYVITTGVRTLNLLHGIIRGCWLVTMEWVLKSLEQKQWLNPVEYEIPHFSKAVTDNRKERMRAEQFGVSHVPDLFAATGYIYVETGTSPPSSALKDLIKAGGGRITESENTAKTIVGSAGLKESWILDCITTGELQPYAQYKRN